MSHTSELAIASITTIEECGSGGVVRVGRLYGKP
jgi:hypothetical protein